MLLPRIMNISIQHHSKLKTFTPQQEINWGQHKAKEITSERVLYDGV